MSSSSSTSSSDTEDSFSRLPSRHVKGRSVTPKGSFPHSPPASPGTAGGRIQENPSTGDDDDTASPNLSIGQRKAKLPSRKARLRKSFFVLAYLGDENLYQQNNGSPLINRGVLINVFYFSWYFPHFQDSRTPFKCSNGSVSIPPGMRKPVHLQWILLWTV